MTDNTYPTTAIVTGAADGLGRATSIALAEKGASVLLVDVNQSGLEETARLVDGAGGQAVVHVADVSDPEAVQGYVARAVAEFGTIDGFFNNAGILGAQSTLMDYPENVFDKVIAVNLRGVFLGLKYVLPVMLAAGTGAVVNTGSMGSVGGTGNAAYVAAKHGVLGLTREAALEVASSGVRVNAVLPGTIATRMALEGAAGQRQMMDATVPMGRAGEPEDIADTVAFLLSDSARHITGVALPVDGGITAQVYPMASVAASDEG